MVIKQRETSGRIKTRDLKAPATATTAIRQTKHRIHFIPQEESGGFFAPKVGQDVILGRGETVKVFNEHYRELTRAFASAYHACVSKDLKRRLAVEICTIIKARGGRFLLTTKRGGESSRYSTGNAATCGGAMSELTQAASVRKTMKALKDAKRHGGLAVQVSSRSTRSIRGRKALVRQQQAVLSDHNNGESPPLKEAAALDAGTKKGNEILRCDQSNMSYGTFDSSSSSDGPSEDDEDECGSLSSSFLSAGAASFDESWPEEMSAFLQYCFDADYANDSERPLQQEAV
uniref:DUF6824 domain-containing protein n=1 Tax=Entomoneis paludosa TaxID=265537 RepID=A0A7S2Y926_9STRA